MLQKEQSFDTYEENKEVTEMPFRLRMYNFLRKFLIGFILISIANLIFSNLFNTPKMSQIERENRELIEKYKLLEERVAASLYKLDDIKHRDINVYRSMFGADTTFITSSVMLHPMSKYLGYEDEPYADYISSAWYNVDQLAARLYTQSISLDELQELATNKEGLSSAIPAIWPIDRTRFEGRHIGAFGMRMHPIYNVYRMHKGVDFGGKQGDPIYATGDAVVEHTEYGQRSTGYGQQIVLNHGFGYKTRYAHLSKRLVVKGDTVYRGQIIGEMGNTGSSVSTHLHYEVIYKNNVVNPINYFERNISNEDYIKLQDQLQDANYEVVEQHEIENEQE